MYGAVDIGGTKIIVGLGRSGELVASRQVPTRPQDGPDAVVARVAATLDAVRDEVGAPARCLDGVGVAVAAVLEPGGGAVLRAANLGWDAYPLGARMRDALGTARVRVENDANCAGLAESRVGAGRGYRNQVYVTVSTGIGAALILDGRLHRGGHHIAGELGHVTVIPNGPRCECSRRGCLEALASGPAIARRARELADRPGTDGPDGPDRRDGMDRRGGQGEPAPTTSQVFAAARRGHPAARAAVTEATTHLGIALANLIRLVDPEVVVVGGGVATGERSFVPMLRAETARWRSGSEPQVGIRRATLGRFSAVRGALCLAEEPERARPGKEAR